MIFKQNLAPRGVCYVSYNAHPFSHLRDMVRDMMRYHTRRLTGMKEKVGQARAILKFLSDGSKANSVHGAVMRDQYNRVLKSPDELLFHDDLDDGAEAFLLHEVAEDASRHGLQYLGDADFSRRYLAGYSEEVRATLQRFPESEFMARDQYQDFIDGNGFRRTLLCHDSISLIPPDRPRFRHRFHLLSTTNPVDPDACVTDDFCDGIREPGRQQGHGNQSALEGSASMSRPGLAASIIIWRAARTVPARCWAAARGR